jgi:hypothetical protein
MSYFLFPKNTNEVFFAPALNNDTIRNYTSFSLYNYCKKLQKDLNNLFLKTGEPDEYFYYLITIVNPYYFVTKYVNEIDILKTKPYSILFFDLLEIFKITKLFDSFDENHNLSSMHVGINCDDSITSLMNAREKTENIVKHTKLTDTLYSEENYNRYDYLSCEIDFNIFNGINDYILSFLQILMFVLKYQAVNGVSVIKIDNLFYKPIIDILYLFCSLYEKVYIVKPTTSNPISFERYIVCKNFLLDDKKKEKYKNYYFQIGSFISEYYSHNSDKNILSIITNDLPTYFLNKLDDMNIMLGHQQLEMIHSMFTILKSKNRQDKIENLKKIHMQKSISWCEKMNIFPTPIGY